MRGPFERPYNTEWSRRDRRLDAIRAPWRAAHSDRWADKSTSTLTEPNCGKSWKEGP